MLIYLANELTSNLSLCSNIKQVNLKHINVFIMNKSREYKTRIEYIYIYIYIYIGMEPELEVRESSFTVSCVR